jgi:hypothetical protein
MLQNETELTAKQAQAIEALLSEPTQEKAAEKAKVSRATLARWLAEPVFRQALKEARNQLLENILTALQAASVKAVQTLGEVMDDTTAQPSARVSAAKAVLDNLLRSREQLELEERLKTLEELLQQPTQKGNAA